MRDDLPRRPRRSPREELLRDRHPHRTVTATGTHNPISPSLSSSVIPFFRLANTGCALVCESHGYEVDLVARTYLQHRDGAHRRYRRPGFVDPRHPARDGFWHVCLRDIGRRILRLWRDGGPHLGGDRRLGMRVARRPLDARLRSADYHDILSRSDALLFATSCRHG